jgi:serine/threonine protein kinase, bacterial
LVGQSVGSRFVLGELIGRGAMGRVHRGTARGDGHEVAIKLLRDDLADQPDIVSRFVQERRLLRTVSHPNVVRVHDLIVDGDVLAIVMDLVSDGDLTRLGPTPLDPVRAATVLAEVADGLGAVHAAGVIHCDLKPANVLVELREDGSAQPKLTDFGVSRLLSGTVTATQTVFGSPGYLAPEVASGRRPTPAADVYALGVMLYDFLTGRHPFVAEHPIALLRAHAMDPVPVPTGLPDELLQLMLAMLDKAPAGRPRAVEVADHLRALAPELEGAGPFLVPVTDDPGEGQESAEAVAAVAAVAVEAPTMIGAPPVNLVSPVNGVPPVITRPVKQPVKQPVKALAAAGARTEVVADPAPAQASAPAPAVAWSGRPPAGAYAPPAGSGGSAAAGPPGEPGASEHHLLIDSSDGGAGGAGAPGFSQQAPPSPPPGAKLLARIPQPYLIGALTLVVLLAVTLAITLYPRQPSDSASGPRGGDSLAIKETTAPSAGATSFPAVPGTTLPVPSAVSRRNRPILDGRPSGRATASGPASTTPAGEKTTQPAAPPRIADQSLPDGTVGVAYSASVKAKGTGSLVFGGGSGLPDGLSLGADGSVTGTPTSSGSSNFTVRVTDTTGRSSTASVSISIGRKTGDVNGDGSVDCTDLGIVQSDVGTDAGRSDVNGDGVVDEQDVAVVVGHLDASC